MCHADNRNKCFLNSPPHCEDCFIESDLLAKLLEDGFVVKNEYPYCAEETKIIDTDFLKSDLVEFKLNQAVLELTTTCSFNCGFCIGDSKKGFASCFCKRWNYKPEDYDYSSFIKALLMLGVQQIIILGGDPFNDPNAYSIIQKVLEIVKNSNMMTTICFSVNGYSLTGEKIEFLKQYKNIIFNIQLVGYSSEDYYEITKVANSYEIVMKNISLLKRAQIPVVGTLLINNINEKYKEKSKYSELELPISNIYLYNHEWACKDKIYDYNQRKLQLDISNYQIFKNLNGCLYGQLFFSSKQDVFPCVFLRDFKLGNLKENQLYEIIKKKRHRDFWFLSKSKVKPCKNCKYNIQCFDCRAIEYAVENKLDNEYYCIELEGE
jgi:MoaA/NifB/PqqE/SkfB family radical SAM enzyme